MPALPRDNLVWGGDWNHALVGRDWSGSREGQATLVATLEELDLVTATTDLPSRHEGQATIDHIALGADRQVAASTRVDARGLSDHDAYVVTLA